MKKMRKAITCGISVYGVFVMCMQMLMSGFALSVNAQPLDAVEQEEIQGETELEEQETTLAEEILEPDMAAGDNIFPAKTKGNYYIHAVYQGGSKNGQHDSYTMSISNVATNVNINTLRNVQVTANYTGNAGNSLISNMQHTTTTEHAALYSDQGQSTFANNYNYLYATFKLHIPMGYKIAKVYYTDYSTRGTLYHLYIDDSNLQFNTSANVKTWNSSTAKSLTNQSSSDGQDRQLSVRSMVDVFYNAGIGTNSTQYGNLATKVMQNIEISPVQMQLQFDLASGTNGPANQTITYDTAFTLPTTVPQRNGYTFGGWTIGGVTYAKGQTLTVDQVNTLGHIQDAVIKAVAVWQPNAYQLAFDLDGGSGAATDQTVYYNGKFKLPAAPVKDGYDFVGWQIGSKAEKYLAGQELAVANCIPSQGNVISCRAIYQVGSYRVRYYRTDDATEAYLTEEYAIDETKTLPVAPQREGYNFNGWSILGATYSSGQSVRNLTKTKGQIIDAFAKWQPIQYSIAYDGNGATGGSTANQDFLVYDSIYRLQPNGYVREYQITYDAPEATIENQIDRVAANFVGWAKTAEQVDEEELLENNATVQGLSKEAVAVTLYARWDDAPLTIHLPNVKKADVYVPAKNEKGEEGYQVKQYQFLGWKELGDKENKVLNPEITITKDVSLQAVYKITETFSKKAQGDSEAGQIMNKLDELKDKLTNGYNLSEEQAQKVIEAIEKGSAVTLKMGDGEYTIVRNADGTLSIQVAAIAQGTKEIVIPSEVKIGSHVYPITEIYKECFKNNTSLEKVTIGTNITKIGDSAFSGCSNLKEIVLSEGLVSIGNRAFEGCKSLTNVKCPASLQTIGNYAFYKCVNLKTVTLQKGLLTIGNYSFYKCSSLQKIRIPDTVLKVGKYAFSGCSKMKSAITSKVCTTMGEGVFYGCKALEKITLKDALTELPAKGFMGCKKLKTVTIPKKIMKIGTRAFYNCSTLQTVKIKSSYLSVVAKEAFKRTKKGIRFTVPTKKKTAYGKLLSGKY